MSFILINNEVGCLNVSRFSPQLFLSVCHVCSIEVSNLMRLICGLLTITVCVMLSASSFLQELCDQNQSAVNHAGSSLGASCSSLQLILHKWLGHAVSQEEPLSGSNNSARPRSCHAASLQLRAQKSDGAVISECSASHRRVREVPAGFGVKAQKRKLAQVGDVNKLLGAGKVAVPCTDLAVMNVQPEFFLKPGKKIPSLVEKVGLHKAVEAEAVHSRGSVATALQVARDGETLNQAVEELKREFWSSSGSAAKRSRREAVMALARAVMHRGWNPPLSGRVVLGVAASLKKARLRTAPALLNELKLWHIEEGNEVPEWMARMFLLAKNSVTRNLGPPKRAREVKLGDIGDVLESKLETIGCVREPGLAYAWATVWMLRGAEVGAVKLEHISFEPKSKTVTLFLPCSKMDQKGLGCRRTLACCGEHLCSWSCAWKVWGEIRSRSRRLANQGYVFSVDPDKKVETADITRAWKSLFGGAVSGHSARRSGAMMYVRSGLPIQELAFLGRWKSAVVLAYAEEALEDVPANRSLLNKEKQLEVLKAPGTPAKFVEIPGTPAVVEAKISMKKMRRAGRADEDGQNKDERPKGVSKVLASDKAKELWAYSARRSRSAPIFHLVEVAGWDIPFADWRTTCGWPFAAKDAKAALATQPRLSSAKCRNCLKLRERDRVNEDKVGRLMTQPLIAKICNIHPDKMMPIVSS